MIFNPMARTKIVSRIFPALTMGANHIQYVDEFKYLGHIIANNSSDDRDISREIRNVFVRTKYSSTSFL